MKERKKDNTILGDKHKNSNFAKKLDKDGKVGEFDTHKWKSDNGVPENLEGQGRQILGDRGDIRVFEKALSTESNDDNSNSERASIQKVNDALIETAKKGGKYVPETEWNKYGKNRFYIHEVILQKISTTRTSRPTLKRVLIMETLQMY